MGIFLGNPYSDPVFNFDFYQFSKESSKSDRFCPKRLDRTNDFRYPSKSLAYIELGAGV